MFASLLSGITDCAACWLQCENHYFTCFVQFSTCSRWKVSPVLSFHLSQNWESLAITSVNVSFRNKTVLRFKSGYKCTTTVIHHRLYKLCMWLQGVVIRYMNKSQPEISCFSLLITFGFWIIGNGPIIM